MIQNDPTVTLSANLCSRHDIVTNTTSTAKVQKLKPYKYILSNSSKSKSLPIAMSTSKT